MQNLVTVKRTVVKLTMVGAVQVGAVSIEILRRSFENRCFIEGSEVFRCPAMALPVFVLSSKSGYFLSTSFQR